jgi:transposase
MAHDLNTLITALLPPTCTVHLTKVTMEQATVRLQLTATAPTVTCPGCGLPSSSVHRRDQRHLTDLPWGTRAGRRQLTVRKFHCRQPHGVRRLFTARLPALVPCACPQRR